MCWINTVDPQAGQIVYSLAMIILPMVTVTCYCYMDLYLILFVKQNYSIIFVHSSNNICVEVPLFRYFVLRCLCWSSSGSSATPSPSTRRLSRISLCECQNIFWEGLKISNGIDFLQIWCLSIKLSFISWMFWISSNELTYKYTHHNS